MTPGYKTTEFWLALGAQAVALLVVFGAVPQSDAAGLQKDVAAVIGALGSIVAYIGSRTLVKVTAAPVAQAPVPPARTLGLLLALSLFAGAALAHAAPAPPPRPVKPPPTVERLLPRDLVGSWSMTWGGGEWDVSLSAFGNYVATTPNGSIWTGTWMVDGEGNWHVSEAPIDETGQRGAESAWWAVWGRDAAGRLDPRKVTGEVRRPDGSARTSVTLRRRK